MMEDFKGYLPKQNYPEFDLQRYLSDKFLKGNLWVITFTLKNTEPQTAANYTNIFTALFPCEIVAVAAKWDAISGIAASLRLTHDKNTFGIGSGNTVLASDFDLTAAARNAQIKMSTSVISDRILDKGDSIGMMLPGSTPTAITHLQITVYIRPLAVTLNKTT